jgi:glycosyltransferase involved in cell wall biosynthesis
MIPSLPVTPIRLIQLSDFTRPEPGSFIFLLFGVLKAARDRGWQAEAVFLEASRDAPWVEEFEAAGLPVHFAPTHSTRKLEPWLRRHIGSEDSPTVLHTHFHAFDLAAALAARRRPRTASVWHVHSALSDRPYLKARNALKFATFGRLVDGVLCSSPSIVDQVRARGIPAGRAHFIPGAVDVERFPLFTEQARAQARARLGIAPDATVLLHFGWHWHLKGGDIFLQAVRRLRDRGREIVALELGDSDRARGEAAALGLDDMVRIVPPQPDVHALLPAVDALVSSGRYEGVTYAALEALCSGVAVVATDVAGRRELGESVAAFRLADAAPERLADGIETSLDRDPGEVAREGAEARDWVVEHFSLTAIAEPLLDYYAQCLGIGLGVAGSEDPLAVFAPSS